MIAKITHSLSARLLALFIATAIVYAYATRLAVDMVLDTDYFRQIVAAHTALHVDYVLTDIGTPPDLKRAKAITEAAPLDIRIVGPSVNWASDPAFPDLSLIPFGPSEFLELSAENQERLREWARKLEALEVARYGGHLYVKLVNDDYTIVFASPKVTTEAPADYTTEAITIVAILVLFGLYGVVRWLIQPVEQMKQGARRIGQGDLEYRIETRRQDDLGDLARDINTMADDVRGMLEAKRELLLAISHELRSPLTRSKVALEFLEDATVRDSLMSDVQEMERLVADLLESERLNTRHSKVNLETIDIVGLVRDMLQTEFPDNPKIRDQLPEAAVNRSVDPVRIRLLMKNLTENALRHNGAESPPVEVSLDYEGDSTVLRVRDYGEGIPPEHLPHITEPFYRADPARARATGGFGLGLHLCRLIAEAHGGELRIDSTVGEGTTVSAVLPHVSAKDA